MNAILLLWDIDHTLTENHGVNKETYRKAFELPLTGKPAEDRASLVVVAQDRAMKKYATRTARPTRA